MSNIKLFEAQKVRTYWDEEKELWYFSIIDIIMILTGSSNPRRYWSDLKRKLEQEGFSQLYDIIVQLKLESGDGKKYLSTEGTHGRMGETGSAKRNGLCRTHRYYYQSVER